jgi:transposase
MMRLVGDQLQVYLHHLPIDMRRGRNGLAAMVKEAMGQDPFAQDSVFGFIGRRYDALKILTWDRNGFCLYSKVIESDERFHWPRLLEQDVIELTAEQMNWLLDGYNVWSAPHRQIGFTHVT